MTYFFHLALAGTLASSLFSAAAQAQSAAPDAGRLRYEGAQHLDQASANITMLDGNGQEIKLGGADSPVELPNALNFGLSLLYSGAYAKEVPEQRAIALGGGGFAMPGPPPAGGGARRGTPPPPSAPPAVDTQFLDLAGRTATTVTTIGHLAYAAPAVPVPTPPPGWHELPQTRKIAGYLCHKATVPFHKQTYTLWVTTELPFTYSPVRELTPARGVVLALRSDEQEFTATRLTAEPVAEAAVRPSPQAQPVTAAALADLRAKAQADARQRLMEQLASPTTR
jgi:hypothetical protein